MPTLAKLLCLHGRQSNAQVTEMQCDILELHKVAVLHCIDGPIEDTTAFDNDIGLGRSWFLRDSPPEAAQEALRRSLIYIIEQIASHGPFDGCYAFSQGAAIASLLCEPQVHGALGLSAPPFRFVVLVCGADYDKAFGAGVAQEFISSCAAQEGVSSQPSLLKLPSLHLMGEKDKLLASSRALAQRFGQPHLLFHKSGHTLPAMELCVGEGLQLSSTLRSFVLQQGHA
eukprot:CAMPEP_0119079532 /NCGR_PEP_ID=MMETSP1178-20130426/107562_1 /TAXON_ID=33656 /ORGANISM="unid sp, Strain CCMP2000" /LENGTH=227 /DNA_ID=CAMNT_0007062057 /DNA_START=29 /DNA_END=712 /DNA_ORIENTATION=+